MAICLFVSTWLSNRGFDPPHRDAVLSYIHQESEFQPDLIERSGACAFQWTGQRRKVVLSLGKGRCPSLEVQLEFAVQELRSEPCYGAFWRDSTMLRETFGKGRCRR